jgi:hypothetical protein
MKHNLREILQNAAITRAEFGGMTIDGVLVSDLFNAYETRTRRS